MSNLDPQTQRILRDLARAHASTADARAVLPSGSLAGALREAAAAADARAAVGRAQSYLPSGTLAQKLREAAAEHASTEPQTPRRRVKARVRPKLDPITDAGLRKIAPDSAYESVTDHRVDVMVSTLTERLEPLDTVVDLLRQSGEREARMEQRAEAAEGRERAAEQRETEALDLARRNYWVAVVACLVTAVALIVSL